MGKIKIHKGDITKLKADAIVNAANSRLMGGGGVDGAIHRAAGPKFKKECREIRDSEYPDGLPTGQAVITGGYNLPAEHVIHTVGPVWHGGDSNESELLADCYLNSLQIALDKDLNSIAFPAISTGVYHFPPEKACKIAFQTVKEFTTKHQKPEKIIFAVIGDNIQIYENNYNQYFKNTE